jgi:ABC-type Fe3+ transport system substrate-binding protein
MEGRSTGQIAAWVAARKAAVTTARCCWRLSAGLRTSIAEPQSMFILKQAPHPNAAKLWVDFVLSERGQNVLVQGEALISGRAGFRSPLPDYAPALDSLNVIKIDYEKISKVELQKMREEWVSIFNP